MSNFKAEPKSRAIIRDMANTVRKIAGVSSNMAFPIIQFIEIFLDSFGYDWEVCERAVMGNNYAVTYPSKKLLQIREDVYEACVRGNGRHRYTLAHELGHIILHNGVTTQLARSEDEIRIFEDPEWQANTFAAELLAPSNCLENLDDYQISERYECSLQVAEIQRSHNIKYRGGISI